MEMQQVPCSASSRVESVAPPIHILIERTVAAVFAVEAAELSGRTRGRAEAAFARQVAMYLAHVALGINLTHVGMAFGRDRTTVRHACRSVEERREEPRLDRTLDLLEAVLRGVGQRGHAGENVHD